MWWLSVLVTSPGETSTDDEIARALIDGALLDVSDRADEARTIRADLIRDLLLGRWPGDIPQGSVADPRGLRLCGAIVGGQLDLAYVHTDIGLVLLGCTIRDGVTVEDGRLARLNLSGSTLGHPQLTEPALIADGLSVTGDLDLVHVSAHVGSQYGAIRIKDGHIGGQLRLRGAKLTNESGLALQADGLTVDGNVYFEEFTATGDSPSGAVRLVGGNIAGALVLGGATIINKSGPALQADGLTVDGDVHFGDGFTATGDSASGAVRLVGGEFGSDLILGRATFANKSGPALLLDGFTVDDSADFSQGFTASGAGEKGAVRLTGGHIGGQLRMGGATLTNKSGPALFADFLTVGASADFGDGFTASGDSQGGAVRLSAGRSGDQLSLDGATLSNDSGPALFADHLTVGHNADFTDGFTTSGAGGDGAVRLIGSQIGGVLNFRGATVTNVSGPALIADSVTVDGHLYLDREFTATGRGQEGTVRLQGCTVRGRLHIDVDTVESLSDRSHRLVVYGMTYRDLSACR